MAESGVQQPLNRLVEAVTQNGDLSWVTVLMEQQRDHILARWLALASEQPFHAGRTEAVVSDHIPALYDALVAFLRRGAPRQVDPGAPMDDADVLAAAEQHAQMRLRQGLLPPDIVVEFRLLRVEIVATLRTNLPDTVPTSDVLAAELLMHDALDGAVTIGLRALSTLVEQVREDFLATTVHDVRQPLSLIQAQTQLVMRRLQRPAPDLERAVADLEQVEAAAKRMSALLATLTDASRIALNQLTLQCEPVDLRDLIEEARAQLAADVAQRVRVELPAKLDTVGNWDRLRLLQVVQNLLLNAAKYAPGDSPITVAVQAERDRVAFSVHDEGIGIAADDLVQLFHRYRRTAAAVAMHFEGLGLGLYLCHGIVEAHGGRIWATSPGPGRGTTVHVVLPRATPAAL